MGVLKGIYEMDSILMCKNRRVYNIYTEEAYNTGLLPGLMLLNPCKETFEAWFKSRYSSNTNAIAKKLKGVKFGQGNRASINKETYALSLSDCYWIKDAKDEMKFEQISPYYNDFWKGKGRYKGGAVPTLYLNGFLTKEWVTSSIMYKYDEHLSIEVDCANLCKECDIASVNIELLENKIGIAVKNLTDSNFMLEQADQSGRLDPDNFDEYDIINLFGMNGVRMLAIDAIIGNGDRHAGNFGWLRDANTGSYGAMAPLYDFDHALDSKANVDVIIEDLIELLHEINNIQFINEVKRICNTVLKVDANKIFKERAESILRII